MWFPRKGTRQFLSRCKESRRIPKIYNPWTLRDVYKRQGMEEKPAEPKSEIAAFASYIYQKDTLPLIRKYLDEGNNPDAPGFFPSWLYRRKDVYAYEFQGECYDIGTPEAYREVNGIFEKRKEKQYT